MYNVGENMALHRKSTIILILFEDNYKLKTNCMPF